MNHGSKYLYILNSGEVTWFVQIIHATHFHHLTDYLVGDLVRQLHKGVTQSEFNMELYSISFYIYSVYKYLISPFIDNRHVYIINEDRHPASSWGSISAADSFFNVAFHYSLYMCI